ncbi:MAG: hypothetical protein HFE35_06050 [Clostridia bacterium]|nr:hypothetical protein [Clostridia bacterium]
MAIPTPKTASKARLAEILLRKHRSCIKHKFKHGIAASPAAPRNDRKRNQPFPLALSLRVSETSAAIFAQKVPPHKKTKGKEKARLKGSMLSSGALYIHINGNKLS